jgi:hypothetical protein
MDDGYRNGQSAFAEMVVSDVGLTMRRPCGGRPLTSAAVGGWWTTCVVRTALAFATAGRGAWDHEV